ncbi:MAG TPA: non-homologous end-joining DNA ligase [Acidobacteriota bacterium]|nr:non-homologous end-joining DNA ligase [Acidobacteriota bacterium]
MGLKEYRRKRAFAKTPEPKPVRAPAATASKKAQGAGLEFVVHKHQATHLHYDLRLEHAGVLKSWAVPKGPSIDPHDKRLAIMVEDHPLSYKDFHGRIPEGEYGAGLVEIWDHGTYEVGGKGLGRKDEERLIEAALRKGHLDFRFNGRKLKGLFTLVRIRPRAGGKDNQWLLMKRREPAPDPGGASSRKADPPRRKAASLKDLDLEGAPKGRFPGPLEPMLATLVDGPFDREGWSFEVKWDGFRSIGVAENGRVRLVSRNGKPLNRRFPTVAAALEGFPLSVVFDGEIVAVDDKGRPDFQALQNSMRTGEGRLLYYVFDILQVDGRDLRPLALKRRRAILERVLPVSKVVRLSEAIETKGRAFFRAAASNGLEGVMAKDMGSSYRPGERTREWLKVKTQKGQEAVICGFTRPRASRRYFGALILGVYRNGELVYIGHVGTGFTEQSLKELSLRLAPLATSKSPFARAPKTNMPVTWVEPRLVCEVKFEEWTAEGLMRQPVFLGLRDDKAARLVVREVPRPSGPKGKARSAR